MWTVWSRWVGNRLRREETRKRIRVWVPFPWGLLESLPSRVLRGAAVESEAATAGRRGQDSEKAA